MERGRRGAGRDGIGTEVVRRERARLPAAGTEHVEKVAVEIVRAGLGDEVQRGSARPAVFRREGVGQDGDFLDGADRHRRHGRLPAPALVIARAIERERRGAARAHARHEVRRVDEEISRSLSLPERGVEKRESRDLAAEDRRLVDLGVLDRAADLRIRPDAFARAEHGHLALGAGDLELHLDRRLFSRAQREARHVFRRETGDGDADPVDACQGKRGNRDGAVRSRRRLLRGAGGAVGDRHGRSRHEGAGGVAHDHHDGGVVRRLSDRG